MANQNAPKGLEAKYVLGGGTSTSPMRMYKSASVILAPGDPVVMAGSADANGVPTVTRGAAGAAISGVLSAIEVLPDSLKQKHLAAADAGFVLVDVNPYIVCEVQEDSVGNNIAATDVGQGVDLIITDADTTLGLSKVMLDSSTAASGDASGTQCQILGLSPVSGNAIGQYAKWLVLINKHTFKATGTLV
jgi:hypothetical protein